ncbi:MAG: hypothetical protein F2520_07165 [Actinobacteria bacterium]|uniref:Unannotated protein n=1 Tax=freshwater metagenome TaxID=449393 RepID=A0A6J5YE47_9ZZZZ|nr:hypothetical protein [Actinomycetota bacterium]
MSDPQVPEFRQQQTPTSGGPSTDPERPKWMMTLAILLLVALPVVGQILVQNPDLKTAFYRFSWTMYSR